MKVRAMTTVLNPAERSGPGELRRSSPSPEPAIIITTPDALATLVRDAVRDALSEAPQNAGPLLLDRASVARALGVGTSSIDRFRRAGMPCVFVGDAPRFIVDECLTWVRANRRGPAERDCEPANDR